MCFHHTGKQLFREAKVFDYSMNLFGLGVFCIFNDVIMEALARLKVCIAGLYIMQEKVCKFLIVL